ncbi:MAG: transporter substrate-binding domain-containing protein [Anaerolineaceae bacterium]|nr:transporter substrate-binding domain-containing protein [Anaerolineaceae bacterium]
MKKTVLTLLLLLPAVAIQAQSPFVPTLLPPTPVPWPAVREIPAPLESAVMRIVRDGRLRVGILYNAPPFGLLNIRGVLAGMEADIARGMGDLWGVELDFVQVTRHSAVEMLRSGEVDLLAAALVKQADDQRELEFCQSHYRGAQALLIHEGDDATTLAQMDGRTLGVVAGARAEEALTRWQAGSGIRVNVRSHFTLDDALRALREGEIDGLVDSRLTLGAVLVPGELRMINEVLEHELHALAVRKGDISMRNLVNRSLQFLTASGRMAEIHDANFPGSSLPHDLIAVWQGLGDQAPGPETFTQTLSWPQQSVVARLEQGQPLRVAGVAAGDPEAPDSERRLAAWRLALAQQLELRLGSVLQAVAGPPLEQLAAGAADLAIGVPLDWGHAGQVEFSAPLLLYGERLLVPADSDVENFRGLRDQWLGVLSSEPGRDARAQALAESAAVDINVFTIVRDEDIGWHLLIERDLDAVFADSLKLLAPLQSQSSLLKLAARCPSCDPWYSRNWLGLALPANDPEFRRRLEAALTGMWRDGSMAQLLAPLVPGEDIASLALQSGF